MSSKSFFARNAQASAAPAPTSGAGFPVPKAEEAKKTEDTLAKARKQLTGSALPPAQPKGLKGGRCPPAALATLREKLSSIPKGGALKGGARPGRGRSATERTVSNPTADIPVRTYSDHPASNNGITYDFQRVLPQPPLAGIHPNVSHGYAPIGSDYNASGLPGSVPYTWREGLGSNAGGPLIDGMVGEGGADIGDGAPGGAQRVAAARFAGAGLFDDSSDSDESLEGGKISRETLQANVTGVRSKLRDIAKDREHIYRRLRNKKRKGPGHYTEPFGEDTLYDLMQRERHNIDPRRPGGGRHNPILTTRDIRMRVEREADRRARSRIRQNERMAFIAEKIGGDRDLAGRVARALRRRARDDDSDSDLSL